MPSRDWKLSPSDFAFLWQECKRCFYLKVVSGFPRPRSIMPKIFTSIDSQMKTYFGGKRAAEVVPALHGGTLELGEKWVESRPIAVPGRSSRCFLRGRLDTLVRFDDGTYGLVDFKTADRNPEHLALYSRQLHAYAWALENAASGKLALSPVTRLGLLVFEPKMFSQRSECKAELAGALSWLEISRDDDAFRSFLAEVLAVLDQASPPAGAPDCPWCRYRDLSRRTGL